MISRLKNDFKDYLECNSQQELLFLDRAFLGLHALFLALKNNSSKTKVLLPASTCPSPVFACVYAGLEPIFVDIKLTDYLADSEAMVQAIEDFESEILCVVYIYLYGHVNEDICHIKKTASQNNIPLIEDAAQAFGAEIGGSKVGCIGDFGVFSFGRTKQIDAGSGGLLLINENPYLGVEEIEFHLNEIKRYPVDFRLQDRYSKHFYKLRSNVLESTLDFTPFREFSDIYQLLYFKEISVDWSLVENRFRMFKVHGRTQRNQNGMEYLQGLEKNVIIGMHPAVKNGYSLYRYSLLTDDYETSKSLSAVLRENDIHCSNLYLPVGRFYQRQGLPNAVDLAQRVINLWVDETVTREYIDHTICTIDDFFESQR